VSDPMEKIAEAVDAGKKLSRIESQMAQLTAVVQANMAEQQRLNNRIDDQVNQLTEGLRDTRERLVCVEQIAEDVPVLNQKINDLKAQVARYIGIAFGAAITANWLITWAIKKLG
jgi:outer membrane murein-binding lipoprotein Lpp